MTALLVGPRVNWMFHIHSHLKLASMFYTEKLFLELQPYIAIKTFIVYSGAISPKLRRI